MKQADHVFDCQHQSLMITPLRSAYFGRYHGYCDCAQGAFRYFVETVRPCNKPLWPLTLRSDFGQRESCGLSSGLETCLVLTFRVAKELRNTVTRLWVLYLNSLYWYYARSSRHSASHHSQDHHSLFFKHGYTHNASHPFPCLP